MAKIHLSDVADYDLAWCGLRQTIKKRLKLTRKPNETTCITCLIAYGAWQKRQRGELKPCDYCTSRHSAWWGIGHDGLTHRACRRHKAQLQDICKSILFPDWAQVRREK